MTTEITLIAAFITGLLGSVHCIGMCGGIVGTLSMGISQLNPGKPARMFPFLLLYNTGRLTSYVLAGILVAALGEASSEAFNQDTQQIGALLSGLFMVMLGLYIAGWWQVLTVLEKAGSHLWKLLQPIGNKLLPVKNYSHAFLLGGLWGWLPCGMVYAMLVFALSSQDSLQGGLIMLAFGLGTLPTLLLLGTAATRMRKFIHKPLVRQLAGTLIILFGLYNLMAPGAHDHHQGHGASTEMQHHQH